MSVKNLTFINNCGKLTEKILEFVGKICIYQKKAVNLHAVLLLNKKIYHYEKILFFLYHAGSSARRGKFRGL